VRWEVGGAGVVVGLGWVGGGGAFGGFLWGVGGVSGREGWRRGWVEGGGRTNWFVMLWVGGGGGGAVWGGWLVLWRCGCGGDWASQL